MSIENILVDDIRPWKNLYVNSVTTENINVLDPVYLSASKNANQNIANGGSSTVVFENVISKTGNISYNNSTGIITINEAGVYVMSFTVDYVENANTGTRGIFISKSGAGLYGNFNSVNPIAGAGAGTNPSGCAVLKCAVNDTLVVAFYNTTGLTIVASSSSNSSFSIVKVA